MLNVGKIEEGFVLDHIKAGKSLSIYEHLQLDKLDCTVAIIKNARSGKMGKKDILKTLNERMLEASDRLEFETAALIRDQIAAITKVTAGQKVVVDPDVEMDVVALAGTPGSVCAAVLRFREGRLTDKREFLFHDTADIAAVREEFLPRYYLDDEQIPKIIAVDALPPDVDALQQALNQKRGSEVQLYVPQRGDKAHLVEMAHTNAVERLARESGRYAREEKLLDELAQVLSLPKPPRAIESYDISNWGDGTSVCGMVTFRDGKPYKAGYRKFRMKTVLGTDDYASLAETVSRRAAEYEKYAKSLIKYVRLGFSGAVYTQTTDVEGEVNGLFTYDRKVMKVLPERFKAANKAVIESMPLDME